MDGDPVELTNGSYAFEDVIYDHNITVTFSEDTNNDGIPDKYQAFVTYKVAHGTWNGTDSAPKTVCIDLYDYTAGEWFLKTPAATLGTTIPTGMTPATGYDAATGSWDTAITASTAAVNGAVYEYDFDKQEFTVNVTVENGTSDPDETEIEVTYGEDQSVKFTPNEGYAFDTAIVDGDPAELTNGSYAFEDVTEDHDITVTFSEDTNNDGIPDKYQAFVTYKVVNGTWNGTDSAPKTVCIDLYDYTAGEWVLKTPAATLGTTVPTGMTPATGYDVASGSWNTAITASTAAVNGAEYTYNFADQRYTIGVTVENGTSNPDDDEISVIYGNDQTITFTAAEGYALDTVTVDSAVAVLNGDTYTFSNVTADHTIKVVYAEDANNDGIPDKYQAFVTYKVAHGTWNGTDSAPKTVCIDLYDYTAGEWILKDPAATLGTTIPTGMTPATGYDATTGSWDTAITASTAAVNGSVYEYDFDKQEFTVNVTVENGTSDPDETEITVTYGEDQSVKFTPNEGYAFDTAIVDGDPVELTNGSYAFEDVTEDHDITVTFSEDTNNDGIPDKYQAFVTYKVAHGTWNGTDSAPKTVCIDLYDYTAGEWVLKTPAATLGTTIPTGMTPATGYDATTGSWDTAITASTAAVNGAVYEYDFDKQEFAVNITVENGTSDPDETEITVIYGEDQSVKFTPAEGYAFDTAIVDGDSVELTNGSYAFENVTEDHDITVTFSEDTNNDGIPDKYQAFVTYKIENGTWDGTDSAPKTVCIDLYDYTAGEWVLKDPAATLGTTIPTGMIPATGYDAATGSWNTAITASTAAVNGAVYTFGYGDLKYTIDVTVENGTSDPDETEIEIVYGEDQTIKFTPDEGYAFDMAYVDGDPVELTNGSYAFEDVIADHEISVTFSEDTNNDGIPDKYQAFVTYKVAHGTWNGTDAAPKTVCIDLYDYTAGEWVLKTPAATLGTTIPTGMIPATGYDATTGSWDTAITASTAAVNGAVYEYDFDKQEFTVNVTVENGTSDPDETEITVIYGEDQTIKFTPDEGYAFDMAYVDGDPVELTNGSYAFEDVTEDHNITVTFSEDTNNDGIPDKYQAFVTYKVAHGTWNGTDAAPKTVCIDLYDYTAGEWVLKTPAATLGTTIPTGMTHATGYDATTGSWDTAITASTAAVNGAVYEYDFDKIENTITVSVNNGTSDPDETEITVTYGEDQTIKFTPDEGYAFDTAIVDGDPVELTDGGYTFEDVTEEHEITVTFSEDKNGDGIPDKYQAFVTYKVAHGTWNGTDTAPKTVCIDLYDYTAGEWVLKTPAATLGTTIPTGMVPATGYDAATGSWDTAITASTAAVNGAVYEYDFDKIENTITVSVNNGISDPDETEIEVTYGEDQSIKFTPDEGYAFDTAIMDGDPVELTNGGYTFEDVTEEHEITVTFSEDTNNDGIPDKYQAFVTYKVAHGTWNGTDSAPKTVCIDLYDYTAGEWVLKTPAATLGTTIPTGMVPATGYDAAAGKWSPVATAATAAVNGSVYEYDFDKIENTITVSVNNGTSDPDETEIEVTYGEDQTIKFTPDEGYAFDTAIVDGDPVELTNGGYTFEDVIEGHEITVTFSEDTNNDGIPDKYQAFVTYKVAHGTWNGTDSAPKTVCIDLYDYTAGEWVLKTPAATLGTTIPTGMIPATGYDSETGKWTPAATSSTAAVNGSVYEYDFDKQEFTVNVTVENGTSDPDETEIEVTYGEDQTVKFTPDEGYAFDTAIVDGEPVELTNGGYTFEDVTEEHEITVTFSEDTNNDGIPDKYQAFVTYKVAHGTWNGTDSAPKTVCIDLYDYTAGEWVLKTPAATLGTTIPTGMIPATGYDAATGSWDTAITASTAAVNGAVYEFDFDKQELTITVNVENGTSDPDETEIEVTYGEDQTVKFTPDEGYAFDTAIVDGDPVELTNGGYTFDDVTEEHEITVTFSEDKNGDGIPDKYQAFVTYKVAHGTWNGTDTAPKTVCIDLYDYTAGEWVLKTPAATLGTTIPTGMTPATGYDAATGSWDTAITASTAAVNGAVYEYDFDKQELTITVSVENGTSDPDETEIEVTYGEDQTIKFTPDEGYAIDTAIVDGEPVELTDGGYTFDDVTEEHEITVTFSEDKNNDGIPDKYQAFVTYKVAHGTWNGTDSAPKTVCIDLYDYTAGEWVLKTPAATLGTTIPTGMIPATGYDAAAGKWSPAATAATAAVNGAVYEYDFDKQELAITVNVENGTSDPDETEIEVTYGEDQTIKFTPDEGYVIDTAIVDGEPVELTDGGYTFEDVTEEHEITVTFAEDKNGDGIPDKYQATVTYKIVNGTWSNGRKDDIKFVFTLKEYRNGEWKPVNPVLGFTIPAGMHADEAYTQRTGFWSAPISGMTPVTGDATYTFSYGCIPNAYLICVEVVNGISDAVVQPITVFHGNSSTIRFKANKGYALDTVTVDGRPAELTDGAYTFTNVKANHNIKVVYAEDKNGDGIPDKYQATVTYKIENGTWFNGSKDDIQIVFTLKEYRNGVWQTITPAPVLGFTVPAGMHADEAYTQRTGSWNVPISGMTPVTGDATYTFSYGCIPNVYMICVEVVNGTSDAVYQPIIVYYGNDSTIRFKANDGYALDTVTVDGTPAELTNGAYTFEDIKANHHIKVVYAEDKNGDGIPDKYQATVTYKIVNGTWYGGGKDDIRVIFTLKEYRNGVWQTITPAPVLGFTIPFGMSPDEAYTQRTGFWSAPIGGMTLVTGDATYIFSYGCIPNVYMICVEVVNGTSDAATQPVFVYYGNDSTIRFKANEGFALDTVTVDGKPAELTDGAYTFENVKENHCIKVVYAEDKNSDGTPDKYQAFVTYKVAHGTWDGTDSAPKTVCIDLYDYAAGVWTLKDPAATLGTTIPTGMIPATGYDIETGKWTPAATAETPAVNGAVYEYDFEKLKYKVTVSVENGTSDPDVTEIIVIYGEDQSFTFEPADGYAFDMAYADGKAVELTDGSFTFEDVTADHDIKVIFSTDKNSDGTPDKYQAFVTYKVAHGTWNGTDAAPKTVCIDLYDYTDAVWTLKDPAATLGTTIPTGMIPATGYDIETGKWTPAATADTAAVNGAVYEYDFEKLKYKVTVSVENGTADPDVTEIIVIYGEDQSFAFEPADGYAFDMAYADGKAVELTDGSFTFEDVTADHDIKVIFSADKNSDGTPDKYQAFVTYKVAHGTWNGTDSAPKTVCIDLYDYADAVWTLKDPAATLGTTIPTGMIPATGYDIATGKWTPAATADTAAVNGAVYEYDFEKLKYTITVSVENGTADPDVTEIIVIYGEDQSFTFAPKSGYAFDMAYADGKPVVLTDGGYTFENVTADHDIRVIFSTDANRDGIPDKYQATVVFTVEHGCWNDGTSAPITHVYTIYAYGEDGIWRPIDVVLGETLPYVGECPDRGYWRGSWNVLISTLTPVTEDAAYVYTYVRSKIPPERDSEWALTLTKVDANDNSFTLGGARFDLYRVGKKTDTKIGTYITNSDGYIRADVTQEGEYYWVETRSPIGYKLDDTKHYTSTSPRGRNIIVENMKTETPEELEVGDHYAYVIGYDDGLVHPEKGITRAETATIFFRLLNEDIRSRYMTHDNDFTDVSEDDWFCTAVSTMAALGIIKGNPDGSFRPNDPITRAEFTAIAARFDSSADSVLADFTDISGHWAEVEISKAVANGWVSGYTDNTFKPDQYITRAEAMAVINRVLNRNPETVSDLLPDMIKWPDNMDTSKWYYLDVQEATNSHDFERRTNNTERWTKINPPRDWAALEH